MPAGRISGLKYLDSGFKIQFFPAVPATVALELNDLYVVTLSLDQNGIAARTTAVLSLVRPEITEIHPIQLAPGNLVGANQEFR